DLNGNIDEQALETYKFLIPHYDANCFTLKDFVAAQTTVHRAKVIRRAEQQRVATEPLLAALRNTLRRLMLLFLFSGMRAVNAKTKCKCGLGRLSVGERAREWH